jgi:hypothetical protein
MMLVRDQPSPRSLRRPIVSRAVESKIFSSAWQSLTVENHVIYDRHQGEILIAGVLHGRRDQAAAWSESS